MSKDRNTELRHLQGIINLGCSQMGRMLFAVIAQLMGHHNPLGYGDFWMPVKEASKETGVAERTIIRRINEGTISALKGPKGWHVRVEEVLKLRN